MVHLGLNSNRAKAKFKILMDGCKDIIRGSDKPTETTTFEEAPLRPHKGEGWKNIEADSSILFFSEEVKKAIDEAYSTVGKEFVAPAFDLIEPHLRRSDFRKYLLRAVRYCWHIQMSNNLPVMDLLLEAHELTLPNSTGFEERPPVEQGTRLMDVLDRREECHPVTSRQTFFAYREGYERPTTLSKYALVLYQMEKEDRSEYSTWYPVACRRVVTELVLCAIEHLEELVDD